MQRIGNTFPKAHRIGGRVSFSAVFDGKVKQVQRPLLAYSIPNQLEHARLGISISRKVGIAVRRNRIKRLIREAFRLGNHDLPRSYDMVIVVLPHEPLALTEYQSLLSKLQLASHAAWEKRLKK